LADLDIEKLANGASRPKYHMKIKEDSRFYEETKRKEILYKGRSPRVGNKEVEIMRIRS
jgi:hypothetical protein